MNPYFAFVILRAGFLILPLGLLTLLGVEPPWSIVIAVVLSVVLSAVFLRDQRRRIAERIADRASRQAGRRHPSGTSQPPGPSGGSEWTP